MEEAAIAGLAPHQPEEPTSLHEESNTSQDAAPPICRICRGEGTSAEPLFYPCKCSGSIKYVHQDCLMEWLSHSQKKYCELCKTPFRFTKLYAPDMPQSLPVHVFVEHMAKYFFRHLLVWLRAAIAISVWIVWLPYFMRAVWSFMFWISDEGLGSASMLSSIKDADNAASTLSSSLFDLGTCPTSPLLAAATTSAVEAEAVVEDVSDLLVRLLLGSFGVPSTSNRTESSIRLNDSSIPGLNATMVPPTLLGNVTLLRDLTRSKTLNRAVVSVLEGQIITVLVIISFILVILVRDYVVQQQPEINMRAAFAAPENEIMVQPPQDIAPPPPPPANEPRQANESDSDENTLPDDEHPNDLGSDTNDSADEEQSGESSPHSRLPSSEFNVLNEQLNEATATGSPSKTSLEDEDLIRLADPAGVEFFRDGGSERILKNFEEDFAKTISDYPDSATGNSFSLDDAETDSGLLDALEPTPGPSTGSPNFDIHSWRSDDIMEPEQAVWGLSQSSSPILNDKLKGKEIADRPATEDTTDFSISQSFDEDETFSRKQQSLDNHHTDQVINPLTNNSWSFAALDLSSPEGDAHESTSQQGDQLATTPFPEYHDPALEGAFPNGAGVSAIEDEDSGRQAQLIHESPTDDSHAVDGTAVIIGNDEDGEPGLVGRVTNFMWGDLNDAQIIDNAVEPQVGEGQVEEDPWVDVPMAEVADDDEEDDDIDAADEDGAAQAAGFDADAIEDLEDFEGVMELIGMRGPVAGLFQNAIFCAVLVSVTIFACIFIPYNIGRVSFWILASPMRLVRLLFEISKLVQDISVFLGGLGSWFALNILDMFTGVVGGGIAAQVVSARKMSWGLWTSAGSRVLSCVLMDFPMSASEIQNFSAISHDALNVVKGNLSAVFLNLHSGIQTMYGGGLSGLAVGFFTMSTSVSETTLAVSSWLTNPSSWVIDLSEPEQQVPLNPELAHWSSLDRFWAILAGYTTVFIIGAMYLQRGIPFSRGAVMHAWEAGIIDFLQQASGIMKVILIISIEMLVFPLYCGLLLDAALLPLFQDTTFKSRILFTYSYPMTSIFVHWFVGTGYMFHFALFVSMCRKIMRPGVLYFIRDPDDPEFHPVRDVLERNLTTQLRKILFSAFVYGALVIVCLGGVVWGLSFAMPGVLPIHYSSNEPVLEFPVDLLFYNFLMPLAVKFFKPSDALHTMYTWWFRKCARALRLTYFLFGERRIDEEGILHLPSTAANRGFPYELLLEVGNGNDVVPKSWRDTFEGGDAKPNPPTTKAETTALRRKKRHLKKSGQLVEDGRFVRAPASDRVKIPKGQKVFLTVNERGRRVDGVAADDLYSSDQYQLVYVPPNFRSRIFLFILFIWLFAALTGVGFTIIPLVFGRKVFKVLIPEHIRTNDIYAFSIGIFILGSISYALFHMRSLKTKAQSWVNRARRDLIEGRAPGRASSSILRFAKLAYAYFFLVIVFPLLTSLIMELYLTIPLHTYMYPPTTLSTQDKNTGNRHTVRVIQAWTLGLLYLKLASRMITSMFPESRAALAVRTILRRGWLRPDVNLLTRAFIMPGLASAVVAIFGPPILTSFLVEHWHLDKVEGLDEAAQAVKLAILYRNSYPVAAVAAIIIKNLIGFVKVMNRWTAGVRDEAYLIGERLHNFGAGATGAKKGRKAWGTGRQRL